MKRKSKYKNAHERLDDQPLEVRDYIYDRLIDNPVADLVEQILTLSKPSQLDSLIKEAKEK